MRFSITVRAGSTDAGRAGGEVDLLLDAAPGTRFAEVAGQVAELAARAGVTGPWRDAASGRPIAAGARLGWPPLLHGAVLVGGPEADPRLAGGWSAGSGPVGPAVHVVGGPDAGGCLPLPEGRTVLGRCPTADLRLDDPELSRRHAVLWRSGGRVQVADLGSTNGTWLGGRQLPAGRHDLPPETPMRLGTTTLLLVAGHPAALPLRPDGSGHLLVGRPPRLTAEPPIAPVELPIQPEPPERRRLPVLSLVLPAVGAGALAALVDPRFAAVGLLSPLLAGGTVLADRRTGRRRHRRALAEFGRQQAAAHRQVRAALTAAVAAAFRAAPDPAVLRHAVTGPTALLWCRRADEPGAFSLRLGTAWQPAAVAVRTAGGPPRAGPVAELPLTVDLAAVGVLGLAGPRVRLLGMARFLLAQLGALLPPGQLRLQVLTADGDVARDWGWVDWLPQTGQPDEARLTDAGQASVRSVVLLDGVARLVRRPEAADLLARAPVAGCLLLALAADPADLPAHCGAVATLGGPTGTALTLHRPGQPAVTGVPDLVPADWAAAVARSLAPLRQNAPPTGPTLPTRVGLPELLAVPAGPDVAATAAAVGRRWRQPPRARTPVGVGAAGPYEIDLDDDGPHLLVAGTTGAGKSELLQALVVGLAATVAPDALAFVLVDFKGGAAFAGCAELPHVAGLVTDLDPALSQRALTSLEAELRRRERLLRAAGAADFAGYRAAGQPAGALARLVVVVDEFAVLAGELPGFVAGLVDVARRGRSLGIHLVLATQRPAGAVSAHIRANTGLRVCLRVTDAAESVDVLGVPAAAAIPARLPGRAYAAGGAAGRVVPFQTAWPGRPAVGAARPTVRRLPAARPADPAGSTSGTDLSVLVAAIGLAASRQGRVRPPAPWRPALPRRVELAGLPRPGPGRLPLGLADLPHRQAQEPFCWEPAADGHLLAAGGPRSGRTTLLRTVAAAAARHCPPGGVFGYAFDGPAGGLAALAGRQPMAAVVERDDVARAGRLLAGLAGEVARRHRSGERQPGLLVLVDGVPDLLARLDGLDHGRSIEVFLRLLADGPGTGLAAALTGDRSLLTGRLAALCRTRLLLPLPDPADYALGGVPHHRVHPAGPPGRAVAPGDPVVEVQIALADLPPAAASTASPPVRAEALPRQVHLSSLPAAPPAGSRLWTLIGIGGDESAPCGVDLATGSFLVAGPTGSGRSTALRTIARSLASSGRSVLLVERAPSDPAALGRMRTMLSTSDACGAVLVDDADLVTDPAAESTLLDLLNLAADRSWGRVYVATPTALRTAYGGLLATARGCRSGLLLRPGPGDGELFGLRVAAAGGDPPGRGLLITAAGAVAVQTALPS